jgi:UDP-N-acetylmuramoyl-tripeptide--D-alanyl-D-alanine ligase
MQSFSLAFIKEALKDRQPQFSGTLPNSFSGFSIDSRTARPGEVFIAFKSDKRDGHDFVAMALDGNATAALVNHDFSQKAESKALPLIAVDDPLLALQDLARHHLARLDVIRVALTGSAGKTTTKELIRAVLAACFGEDKVFATSGTLNNHLGVPLSALNVEEHHHVAVFELGMNHFGEIKTLANIVRPTIGLITNIGTAHSGNLGGPEGVAKAKAELFEALPANGIAIVNLDDPRAVREAERAHKGAQLTFGKSPRADVRLVRAQEIPELFAVDAAFEFKNKEHQVRLPLIGLHNAHNAAAALAVAMALAVDFDVACKGLTKVARMPGRLFLRETPFGATLIDDTYNANPDAVEAGLYAIMNMPAKRHIVVLGDMAELGDNALDRHRMIGSLIAQKNPDALLVCGEAAKGYIEGAVTQGYAPERCLWAASSEKLAPFVLQQAKEHDVIWVKGARFMRMENVVSLLMAKEEFPQIR